MNNATLFDPWTLLASLGQDARAPDGVSGRPFPRDRAAFRRMVYEVLHRGTPTWTR